MFLRSRELLSFSKVDLSYAQRIASRGDINLDNTTYAA